MAKIFANIAGRDIDKFYQETGNEMFYCSKDWYRWIKENS